MSDTTAVNQPFAQIEPTAARRTVWLLVGLAGFGVSLALLIKANLGLDPWDVLNQGMSRRLRIPIGWIVDGVGALVLVAWIPLRQRPGIGTVANVILVGLVVNAVLPALPDVRSIPMRLGMLAVAITLNATSTGLYIGAGLGPGPRDGLMTGIAARGYPVRVVRTSIELSVLFGGFLLGGSVGVGTIAYALAIGPLVHFFMPRLALRDSTSKGTS